jgi:hypothetical protein
MKQFNNTIQEHKATRGVPPRLALLVSYYYESVVFPY